MQITTSTDCIIIKFSLILPKTATIISNIVSCTHAKFMPQQDTTPMIFYISHRPQSHGVVSLPASHCICEKIWEGEEGQMSQLAGYGVVYFRYLHVVTVLN